MAPTIKVSEWEKIQSLVAPKQKTVAENRRDEKKLLSESRVKHWPGTLHAIRTAKENFVKRRAEEEEALRAKFQKEEEERREKERRATIKAAHDLLYSRTDIMKRLAGAELLSDCLETRRNQMDLNHRIKACESKWEEQFLAMEKESYNKKGEREDREAEERKRQAVLCAEMQTQQIEIVRQKRAELIREKEEEGKRMVERAKKMVEEEKAEQIAKIQRQSRVAHEIESANMKLKEVQRKHREVVEAEESRRLAEQVEKLKLKERYAAQQAKIHDMKQKRKQRMIDQGTARLAAMVRNDNERLNNQIAEAKAKSDAREKAKSDAREKLEKEIDESRATQVRNRQKRRADEEARNDKMFQQWREYSAQQDREEEKKRAAQFEANKAHESELLDQAAAVRRARHNARQRDVDWALSYNKRLEDEEQKFADAAMERVRNLEAAGKDPYPLRKCLLEVGKKKLLPARTNPAARRRRGGR